MSDPLTWGGLLFGGWLPGLPQLVVLTTEHKHVTFPSIVIWSVAASQEIEVATQTALTGIGSRRPNQ